MAANVSSKVTCTVCSHGCRLNEGQVGVCHARVGRDGSVVSQSYGRITSLALDPIEKKPFALFMPGTKVLSLGSYGCNMACPWCQNSSIAAAGEDDVHWLEMSPQRLVERAVQLEPDGCVGLAYTYNEPLVGYEFVRDCAKLAHQEGLKNVIVSNGMATAQVWDKLLPFLDAANIDLKCFDEEAYREAGGSLRTVAETIQKLASVKDCHLEVTWLVVPGVSDDSRLLAAAACWLASMDPDIPLHVTRFFPCHRMAHKPATEPFVVRNLAMTAKRHLSNVFVGNC